MKQSRAGSYEVNSYINLFNVSLTVHKLNFIVDKKDEKCCWVKSNSKRVVICRSFWEASTCLCPDENLLLKRSGMIRSDLI